MTSLTGQEILKMDTRGRVRTPAKRREALLDEFEGSGVSMAEFARLAGVKYQTFALWVSKRQRKRSGTGGDVVVDVPAEPASQPVRLWEAVVDAAPDAKSANGALVIELPGGARLAIASSAQVGLAVELLTQLTRNSQRPC